MESNENDDAVFNLKPAEIINPLIVIADFFDVDSLDGHLERLQTWRRCIMEDQYFKGDKGSPSELLHFHKLNVCLLEAAYLLKDENCLTTKSIYSYITLKQVFDDYNLSTYRAILYQWLEFGLSVSAANEFIDTIDLIGVYEILQKLYKAAWHIHQQAAGNSMHLGANSVEQRDDYLSIDNSVTLYDLNTAILSHQQETISNVVAKIKEKVPSVQAIIYLGQTPAASPNIFLMVLVDDNDQRQLQCIASTIEDSCRNIASVIALVHRPSRLNRSRGDNLFFSNALKCPLIYHSGEILLPFITAISHDLREKELLIWRRWTDQGKDFLKGGEYYLNIRADQAALFSLQQAAECFLMAIIRVVNGYTTNIHNLSTLLNITRMFTNDIANVFDLENQGGKQLFNVLKNAYINVRYKDTYEADKQDVRAIYPYIKKLMVVVEKVYEHYLLTSNL